MPESGRDRLVCVNIGVRDYDYFIRQSQQIYARQVRLLARICPSIGQNLAVTVLFMTESGRYCLIYARVWP